MSIDRRAYRSGLLLLLAVLGGCSLAPWRGSSAPAAPPASPAALPPVPELPLPHATHRFELAEGQDVVGRVQRAIAAREDTLPDIARRFNVGYEEIVRANPGVDPWLPGAGRTIVVPTEFILPNALREGVVINLPAMRIFYFPKRQPGEAQVVYTHPIGVGKVGWSTPEGVTRIISREKDPIWRPSAAVRKEHAENDDPIPPVVLPGPDNPLGKYKFNLGWQSYLIHGTNKPYGVGLRSSHGCIRLYPEDIERLFEAVPIGTRVQVVNQPYVLGIRGRQLHVQTYDVLADDKRNWSKARQSLLAKALPAHVQKSVKDKALLIDWPAVLRASEQPRGLVVPVDGIATPESVAGSGHLVQNRIPADSNWDGADDIARDEASYRQLLAEREWPAAGS